MGKIVLDRLNNTRDISDIRLKKGRIIPGKLFRSGQLGVGSEADHSWLRENIDTVIDFRTVPERDEVPDPAIGSIENIHIAVVEDIAAGVSRDSQSNEEIFRILALEPERAKQHMCGIYESFITSETARRGYERFVRKLLSDDDKATLWHCTAGKDRAGFATVIVLEILGADKETIRADYLATNEHIEPDIKNMMAMLIGRQGAVDSKMETALRYMLGAYEEYLDTVYAKAEELYGDMKGYIRDGLRITDAEIEQLKQKYIKQ